MYVPFDDDRNRSEVFLIAFDGLFENTTYMVMKYLLDNIEKYESKYPVIRDYEGYKEDIETLYILSLSFSRENILPNLSNDTLSYEECLEDLLTIENNIDFSSNSLAFSFSASLNDLATDPKIERVYIYSANMTESKKSRIEQLCQDVIILGKINVVESSDIKYMLEEEPSITSIFVDDVRHINNLMSINDILKNKQIFSYKCLLNCDKQDFMTKQELNLLYLNSTVEDLYKSKQMSLAYMNPEYVDITK